jgi:adenylate cyclase
MKSEFQTPDSPSDSVDASARSQAFLFADIAGFTTLTEAHGDEQAAEVVDHFFEHASNLLERFGGEQVKTIGDAVMVRADSAVAAVRFGVDLAHHEMAQHEHPGVGVGIAWGPASDRGGDWIGSTVNTAARIAALADRGEVLLSTESRAAAGEIPGIRFQSRGPMKLRGFRRPVEIYEAKCEDVAAALHIDPVCRMALDPKRSHGAITHRGLDYYFCSRECLQTFREEPDTFISDTGS